jgi:hypothetical protein
LSAKKTDTVKVKTEHADSDDDGDTGAAGGRVSKKEAGAGGAEDVHDISEAMEVDNDDEVAGENEVGHWPECYGYSRDQPASVPFGPPSAGTWESLSEAPLFAHPKDTVGLNREETESTMLIQFPTSVLLGNNNPRSRGKPKDVDDEPMDLTADGSSSSSGVNSSSDHPTSTSAQSSHFTEYLKEQKLAPGRIGKLQIMESGKVFLVTDAGLKFELYAGLTTCFSQYVAAVDIAAHQAAAAANVKAEPVSDAGSGAAMSSTQDRATGSNMGQTQADAQMYMLSPVTRKVIVAPAF